MSLPFEIIPFHAWWGMAAINLSWFLLLSILVFPMTILPAMLSLITSARAFLRRKPTPAVCLLFFNAAIFAFLPMSIVYDPLGLSRATLGLIVSVLTFGAEQQSRRTLRYATFWLITVLFLYKDSFMPFR